MDPVTCDDGVSETDVALFKALMNPSGLTMGQGPLADLFGRLGPPGRDHEIAEILSDRGSESSPSRPGSPVDLDDRGRSPVRSQRGSPLAAKEIAGAERVAFGRGLGMGGDKGARRGGAGVVGEAAEAGEAGEAGDAEEAEEEAGEEGDECSLFQASVQKYTASSRNPSPVPAMRPGVGPGVGPGMGSGVDRSRSQSRESSRARDVRPASSCQPLSQTASRPVPLRELFRSTEYLPEDFGEIDIEAENRDPQLRREKQEILFTLLKTYPTESKGQWNMKMPLFELKYELMRREQFSHEEDQLVFMKEMMKMILTGIEIANERFGPILQLKGWAQSVTSDMGRYDRCLRALYHRYFRKKQVNPVMELMWLILGSAAMWHMKNKFLGEPAAPRDVAGNKPPSDRAFFDNVHDIRPPPGGKVPFAVPGAGQKDSLNIGSLLKLFTR